MNKNKRIKELESLIDSLREEHVRLLEKLNKDFAGDVNLLPENDKQKLKDYVSAREKYGEELYELTRTFLSHQQKQDERKLKLAYAKKFINEGDNLYVSVYMDRYIKLMQLLDEILSTSIIDDDTRNVIETFYGKLDRKDFVGIKRK